MNSRNRYASNPTYGAAKRMISRKKAEPAAPPPSAPYPNQYPPQPGYGGAYPPAQQPQPMQGGYPAVNPGMPQQPGAYGYPQQPYPQQPYQPPAYSGTEPQQGQAYQQNYTVLPTPEDYAALPKPKDAWVKILLMAVLPILFVVTLILPEATALKWVFVGGAAVGLLGMWFFSGFASSAKTTLSLVYVALVLMTVVTLLVSPPAGGNTGGGGNSGGTAQTSANQGGLPANYMNDPATQPSPSNLPGLVDEPDAAAEPTPGIDESSASVQVWKDFYTFWSAQGGQSQDMFAEMLKLCAPSWKSGLGKNKTPESELFSLLRNRVPSEMVIENVSNTDADQTRTITCTAMVQSSGRTASKVRLQIVVLKENGTWYVSPVSLTSNEPIVTPDPNAAQAQSEEGIDPVGAVVATPTPAPDKNTKLYYNKDGGRYYHLDPNCSSLATKYKPLKTYFAYKDVSNSKYKNLLPCDQCHAPAR